MTSGDEENARIAAGYSESVERLTGALIAAIEDADVSYPQAKHALTRALGAIIGSNTPDAAARSAAVLVAGRPSPAARKVRLASPRTGAHCGRCDRRRAHEHATNEPHGKRRTA